jgi:hypothetical protein
MQQTRTCITNENELCLTKLPERLLRMLWYHESVARPSFGTQVRRFFQHILPAIIRPIHSLWHEIIGFVFLALAVWAAPRAYNEIVDFKGDAGGLVRIAMAVLFAGLMTYYGITSFLRARKISRS